MIKMFIAGSREFATECSRQAEQNPDLRVIGLATEPSTAVDVIENHASEADAVLFGFPDEKIKLMIDMITRHEVKAVTFVSVENLSAGYKTWTPYKAKCVQKGKEIATVINFFKGKPELLKDGQQTRTTLEPDTDIQQREARVHEVRRREAGHKAVAVKNKVVAVYSQKGGTGKTTIIVSLAQSVSVLSNLKVCILDLDMTRDFGDAIRYLGIVGDKKADVNVTLAAWEAFPWEEKNIWSVVEQMVVPVRHGLYVLPAIRTVSEEQDISNELVKKSIEVLRRHFDLVLVDLGNLLGNAAMAAANVCDEMLIVDNPDLPIIDSLKDFLDYTFKYTGLERSQVGIILNRLIPELKFKVMDISSYLGLPVVAAFPEDSVVRIMLANECRVPYLGSKTTPFVQEIEKVMCHLYPREAFDFKEQTKSGIGFFNFFKKLRFNGGKA